MPDRGITGADLLRENVPELFNHPGTILYVGASPHRFDLRKGLIEAKHKIVLLERYYPNCTHFRCDQSLEWVIYGDVRDIWKHQIPIPVDIVIWWHGPEHIREGEFHDAVFNLEIIAGSLVVLASPWGMCPQGDTYGNLFEVHRSTLYKRHYVKLGYQVATCGAKDKPPRSDLIAWKYVGGPWYESI